MEITKNSHNIDTKNLSLNLNKKCSSQENFNQPPGEIPRRGEVDAIGTVGSSGEPGRPGN